MPSRRDLRSHGAVVFAAACLALPLWAAGGWETGFKDPPSRYSMGVYWWWFGPAVTRPEVERELNVMRRSGIGSVLIYPVYPLSVDDPQRGIKNLRYLSPEFLDVLRHTVQKAGELGLAVDIVLGTGWPYGGPSITPHLAARRLRVEKFALRPGDRPALPALKAEERLVAALAMEEERGTVKLSTVAEAKEEAAASPRLLMVFIDSPTGMRVKRPSLGAEGLVLDHLNSAALARFLDTAGSPLLNALKPGSIRALHSDSLEVFGQEWTGNFLDEFARRRGYDLKPYLPALVAEAGPLTADIRSDYWRTVGELALDNYVRPLHDWCRRRGVELQSESYGTPPVDMGSFEYAEAPMGESYDWKMFVASRWASSAAHQLGRTTTSAEAYTWLRFPRYVSTLQDLKLGSDLHFLCGVNRLVAHGYGYSPPAAGIPGWGYYASVMLNDNNPWWPYFPRLADYVRRASYALSLAKPRVDVALYLPEDDVMAEQPIGDDLNLYMSTKWRLGGDRPVPEFGLPSAYRSESPVIKTILAAGYSFDGFDRGILRPGLRTSGGRLEVGDVSYRIAVLPDLRGISLPILERLAEFCRSGGTLVATRRLPAADFGLQNRDANYARVTKIMRDLFGEGPADRTREVAHGRGRAIFVPDETTELARVLASLGPEVTFSPHDPDLFFLHRGDADGEIYFLANTSAGEKTFKAVFRDGKGSPRLWDAMSGDITDAHAYSHNPAGTEVLIRLEPYGSTLVVFDGLQRPATGHEVTVPRGALAVPGPWWLRIGGAETRLEALNSWTQIEAHRFFSGCGTYRAAVDLPGSLFGAGRGLWLDLGEAREIADVAINGAAAGVCWKQPYRLDISRWARPGRNEISVAVTNLLINKVLGDPDPDPDYSGLEPLRFPRPEEKKRISAPLPSGLLGPVRIVPYETVLVR